MGPSGTGAFAVLISSPEHPPGGGEPLFVPFVTLKWADFMLKNDPQAQVITLFILDSQVCPELPEMYIYDLLTSTSGAPSIGHFASGLSQNSLFYMKSA